MKSRGRAKVQRTMVLNPASKPGSTTPSRDTHPDQGGGSTRAGVSAVDVRERYPARAGIHHSARRAD